jgi:hypothetical protein
MKNITLINKLFFAITALWYFTFFSGIYYSLPVFDGIAGGRLHSSIDGFIILIILLLFAIVVKNSIKNRDYIIALLSVLIILWPMYWMYLTIYDTFFLFNTPYARCMQEFNDITRCEGL